MEGISMSIIGGADGPTSIFLAGVINTQILVVTIVVGLLIGAGIGAVIVNVAELSGTVSLAVIIGCGGVMALLSLFLRRVGAFFSVLCYVFAALMTVLPTDKIIFIIVAGVVALVLAVVAAIYVEPLVVTVSSIAGGLMAGPTIITLIGMEEKIWIGYIIAVILAGLGMLIQLLMQSGKIKKKDKQHSEKVKEEDSMESEVEKARMILDDENDYIEAENLKDKVDSEKVDDDDDLKIIVDEEL